MVNWKIASLTENHVFERQNLIHFPLLKHFTHFYLFVLHLHYKIFVYFYEILQ